MHASKTPSQIRGAYAYARPASMLRVDRHAQTHYKGAAYLIQVYLRQDKSDPWFVTAYLRTPSGRQAMAPFILTTAGQSNIGLEGLKQIPMPLPPITMQRHFRTHIE